MKKTKKSMSSKFKKPGLPMMNEDFSAMRPPAGRRSMMKQKGLPLSNFSPNVLKKR